MPSDLKREIKDDLDDARRAGERLKRDVLSMVLSDIRNHEIDLGEDADDDEVRKVLSKAVKQREEAAEQMRDGGRPELAEKEEKEAEILSAYLPPPLEEEDVREMVRQVIDEGADSIGPIMGRIMPRIRGRFDGGEANRIVREELAK